MPRTCKTSETLCMYNKKTQAYQQYLQLRNVVGTRITTTGKDMDNA